MHCLSGGESRRRLDTLISGLYRLINVLPATVAAITFIPLPECPNITLDEYGLTSMLARIANFDSEQ